MAGFLYVISFIEGLIALAQLVCGGDASQATLLCLLWLILAKLSDMKKGKSK